MWSDTTCEETLKYAEMEEVRSAKSSVINIYSGERHGLVI